MDIKGDGFTTVTVWVLPSNGFGGTILTCIIKLDAAARCYDDVYTHGHTRYR